MPNLGAPELLIVLVVALLLFGGTRLAGMGKGAGRAIREFKEEVKTPTAVTPGDKPAETTAEPEVVDAEIVTPETRKGA